jgi:uncharacterized lipoprotein YmbA
MRLSSSFLVLLFMTGCGAAEAPHYYTLVPEAAPALTAAGGEPIAIEVLPIEVPAQVDTSLMVVREGGAEVVPVGSRRWVAPLHDEIRTALSSSVSSQLGARDVSGAGASGTTYRIKVIVRRFDSSLGANASLVAVWTVRETGEGSPHVRTCETHVTEPAQGGFDALALGHQRAIAKLARQIADNIRVMHDHLGDAQPGDCAP